MKKRALLAMLADYDDDCEIKISAYHSEWERRGGEDACSYEVAGVDWRYMVSTDVDQGEDGTIYLGAIDD